MYRARVVFNGPQTDEYPFYSIAYRTEGEVRAVLDGMKPALVHAVSVLIQESNGDPRVTGGHWTNVARVQRRLDTTLIKECPFCHAENDADDEICWNCEEII